MTSFDAGPGPGDAEAVATAALRIPAGLPDGLTFSGRCDRLGPLWRASVRVDVPGGPPAWASHAAPGIDAALRLAFGTALRALAERGAS